ncbi:MAG: TRM11 family SAM-dependent methyltransferase [Candidatus Xenobia bacterium]
MVGDMGKGLLTFVLNGIQHMQNALNELSGSEWLYWTSTVYETNFPPDPSMRLRKAHGAMKPPELMAEIINFFTRSGERILDPFAGVGGTLIGAALSGRQAVGLELSERWVDVYRNIQNGFVVRDGRVEPKPAQGRAIDGVMHRGDCLELMQGMEPGSFEAIITDPPYGWQHGATGFADETNFNMVDGHDARDFGHSADLEAFLERMEAFGREAFRLLASRRYLIVIIGDRYLNGEMVPLGVLTAERLRRVGFQFKGLRLWWNKATQRPLKPYAVKTAFVPNIVHQNILVLRRTM